MTQALYVPAAAEHLHQRLPDLSDPETARRLTAALPAVVRMLDDLQVNRSQQARLLDLSERTLQRALQGDLPKRLSVDQFTRMSLVTGIYKALRILFVGEASKAWLTRPNGRRTLNGQRPLDYMLSGGIPAMLTVRQLLDADRSGQFGDAAAEDRARAAKVSVRVVEG
ncbi:hypothetical protein Deipr_2413 (plasmid) [Deinococcus proteolyticus MRP]|uniref:Uncharacterized protein n=1 Tax=Deinococcus proteolyticus (strain ATCC 35074 / DSM 20540 / JCM 6276 / NBRC 101906 / NCIMB 13154 / VKM Ac-1939 / CCM 2703 / MRP) TaxID=693977 RepID=F0RQH8_DEIPM|nr:antitoxin Xre/MbcA/ParS toxin-binding domain-containing protein [Deinococcus proteolyticus]ADY27537.1 hypothetical protein Deipr_2413 [Deinococcus proteolyticus MRP]